MLHQNPVIITCILICCTVLTACVTQSNTLNQTVPSTTAVIISPAESPTINYPPINETSYIIINPIKDHFKNETFEINGTTNLGADEKIYYIVSNPDVQHLIDGPPPNPVVTSGFVNIVDNGKNKNNWSFQFNASATKYFGDVTLWNDFDLELSVYARNRTVSSASFFTLRHDVCSICR